MDKLFMDQLKSMWYLLLVYWKILKIKQIY